MVGCQAKQNRSKIVNSRDNYFLSFHEQNSVSVRPFKKKGKTCEKRKLFFLGGF